ncbi:MAG: hypothetical protein A2W00_03050 [Candidatus Eisenbacteria bacterium RBG_16_71_46]|nr:MAG: hypothetical protein A2W00_03050 [Candidatus Eisenbacteria bacterium RBG_16_71_46]
MRFDLALFELRLFKSRTAAQEAIERGDARLNGGPVKPSHALKPGDRVTVAHGDRARTYEVLGLPRRGLGKEAARALVREIGEA